MERNLNSLRGNRFKFMARKRPSALDALEDVAPPIPKNEKKKATQKATNKPATYRLPETIIEELKNIADSERVKISDLVTFALQNFIQGYETGKIVLPKAEPSYYRLDLS